MSKKDYVLLEKYKALGKPEELQKIRHGKWIDETVWYKGVGQCRYRCSCCGYVVNYKPNSRGDGRGGKYCDDCGAKMDCEVKYEVD